MTQYDVKRLALVLAVQAEIENAKLDNEIRKENGTGFSRGWTYPPEWFAGQAEELRRLAYAHDEQL